MSKTYFDDNGIERCVGCGETVEECACDVED